MKSKKDLDDFLRGKLGELKETPREEIWKNIRQQLEEDEDNRGLLIPLWLKLAGVAAVIALMVFVGNKWMGINPEIPVAGENEQNQIENTQIVTGDKDADPSSGQENDLYDSTDLITASDKDNSSVENDSEKSEKSSIAGEEIENVISRKNTSEEKEEIGGSDFVQGIVKTEDSSKEISPEREKTQVEKQSIISQKQIAGKTETSEMGKDEEKQIADSRIKSNNEKKKHEIARNKDTEYEENIRMDKADDQKDANKDLRDGIAGSPNDQVFKNTEEKEELEEKQERGKSIFDEIAKNQKEDSDDEAEKLKNRFSIRPNIAPIYYNSMTGGSATDPKFANNKTTGDYTMAAGIDFAYAVSKRLKVRTGIGMVNVSYNTHDIAFTSSASAVALQGIELTAYSKNIMVMDRPGAQHKVPDEVNANVFAPYTYGEINQQFEYFEIPLEVEYTILDERFGISVMGGASTLLLSNDLARIKSEYGTTGLGRGSNLNDVSFTTNIGLGFDYNLTDQLVFNVEPKFKYQLNGFKGDTGNFRPYFFGVYSGVSFKF